VEVHAEIAAQVRPAVVDPEVAIGGVAERWPGDQRAGGVGVVGEQRGALAGRGVIVPGGRERRVVERVDLVGLAVQRPEVDVDQQRRTGRVAGIGLGDPIPARARAVDLLVR
jgi:hypothetical protein